MDRVAQMPAAKRPRAIATPPSASCGPNASASSAIMLSVSWISPPAPGSAGEWQVEASADGVKSLFVDASGKLLGFALNGAATAERAKLVPQLPPVLA